MINQMELWCILEAEERWIVANGQNPELAEVVRREWYWQAGNDPAEATVDP